MQTVFSHLALGFCFVLISCVGESSAWGQSVEEVNYTGWEGVAPLRCGGCCLPFYRRTVKLSFFPMASLEDRQTPSHQGAVRRPVPRQEAKKCQCINEALSLYGLVWVGLQRKEVSPEQAKSQLTAHLEWSRTVTGGKIAKTSCGSLTRRWPNRPENNGCQTLGGTHMTLCVVQVQLEWATFAP